jgi:hypothetical protein
MPYTFFKTSVVTYGDVHAKPIGPCPALCERPQNAVGGLPRWHIRQGQASTYDGTTTNGIVQVPHCMCRYGQVQVTFHPHVLTRTGA